MFSSFCCNQNCSEVSILVVVDQLPRLGKSELICLLLFTCNYVVSVWRDFLFLWVLGMGYVILLWHSLSLPYNYCDIALIYVYVSFYGKKQRNVVLGAYEMHYFKLTAVRN